MSLRSALASGIYWIMKGAVEDNRRRYTGASLFPYQYGRALETSDDPASQVKAFRSWVYICATKNADAVASAPLRLYVAKKPTRSKIIARTKAVSRTVKEALFAKPGCQKMLRDAMDIEEVVEHPFHDLMTNVNGFANQFDLFARTDIHLELSSSGAYWYLVKDESGLPRELWLMPTERMRVIPDEEKFIKGYVYLHGIKKVSFEEEDIIHFKLPSARSSYYSHSPLQAIAEAYNINAQMNVYETSVFKNMGALSGWFSTEQELGDKEFDRLTEQVRQMYGGAKNAGKVGVGEKGIKYQELGFSPKDLGFLNGRRVTRQEIMSAFGVPEALVDREANRANADAADYIHKRDTVRPRLKLIEDKLNEKLIPMYGDDSLFVAFDNVVPEDREFELKERTEHIKVGLTTRNEERAQMGYEPVDDGDTILIPAGFIPIDKVGQQTTVDADSNTDGEKRVKTTGAYKAIEFGSDEHKALWGAFVKVADAQEKKFVPALKSFFKKQQAEALKNLEKKYGGKAIDTKVKTDYELFDPDEWEKILAELGYTHISDALIANAKRELAGLSVGISFDADAPAVTRFLEKHVPRFSFEVNDTTREALKKELIDGLGAGESIAELSKRVKKVFGFAESYRAKRIARTEVSSAANFGAEQAYVQSDAVDRQQWIAAVDERTRESHLSEHGNVADIGDGFPVTGMKRPGDPDGPVAEIVNCRCTLAPVLKKVEG